MLLGTEVQNKSANSKTRHDFQDSQPSMGIEVWIANVSGLPAIISWTFRGHHANVSEGALITQVSAVEGIIVRVAPMFSGSAR